MIRKNDEFILEIEDMGVNGEGIGHVDGLALFVKDALIGDTVRVKVMKMQKNYGFARLLEVIAPSADRIAPLCPVARSCGGCQIQEMNYPAQLKFKAKKVKENLERIGKLDFNAENAPEFYDCIGMDVPWNYRNKAQFPIGRNKEGKIIAGFYAGRTHSIIECEDCAIGIKENKDILHMVIAHMEKWKIEPYREEDHKGLVRHVLIRKGFTTGEIMVCLILNGKKFPGLSELVDNLKKIDGMTSISINVNTEHTNRILGSEVIPVYQEVYITDYIGDVKFRISPLSFYQVNPVQTRKLYGTALDYAELTGEENVFDLYCGVGTISLFLAKKAKHVIGVEIVGQAIEDAKNNAKLNGITNAQFFVGKAEEVLPQFYENAKKTEKITDDTASTGRTDMLRPDVIVVDPPRKGCDEKCLDTMLAMSPERIVYVSCDSATLARDLKILCEEKYELMKWQAFDQFSHTTHVETVVLLSHKKPDGHINVKVEFGEGEGKVPLDNIAKRAEEYKPKERVTYKMIKEYIEAKYGFKVHTAYIAEVKRDLGLPMYDAPNAVEELKQPRKHPTAEKVEAIKDALKHFEVI